MRKAMAFLTTSILLGSTVGAQAQQEGLKPNQIAMTYVPGNPLMALPGMQPGTIPQVPVAAPLLPAPVITDVFNAPNPFDSRKAGLAGQTMIDYTLSRDLPVRVTLYDLLGFRVRRWDFSSGQNGGRAGENKFFWDGTNENGQKVAKGGYLAQIEIEAPDTVVTVIRKIGVIH